MKRVVLLVLTVLVSVTSGASVVYEGDEFPDQAQLPWERDGTFDADRWLDNGWLFQFLELGVWKPPPYGENDMYRRWLTDFAGEEAFFVEWRVETDVAAVDMIGVPVVVSAFGTGAALYHFTMTADTARLIRDTHLPIINVDVDPAEPHTYRLELHATDLYAWYVDGELIDSGLPQGSYPNTDSRVLWGAQYYLSEHTTRWDYIRYGTIPEDGSGDYDSDGAVDLDDFYYFQECLLGPGVDAGPGCRFADMNRDGAVDMSDFLAFQDTLVIPE